MFKESERSHYCVMSVQKGMPTGLFGFKNRNQQYFFYLGGLVKFDAIFALEANKVEELNNRIFW